MKWKKRPSEILLLILTFILPVASGNHQSGGVRRVSEDRQNGGYDVINDKNANNNNKNVRSLVPGHQTAMLQNGHVIHLDHLRLLDPYNLIASMKENGNKLDPFLAELLPEKVKLGKNKRKHPNNIEGSRTDYGEDVNSLSPESTNDSNDNSSSVNATDDGLNSSTRSKEDSYFEESDFDLYDDYDDVGIMTSSDDGDFNRNTKVAGRRRKKGNSRNSEGHNALLHEAVRKLLGFSRSHSWGQKKSRFLPDPYGQEKIPRYVKDLYERFQSGEMNAGLAQGNTIRSIHASVGDVEGESMFLFNLSSLRSSERLLNAEIHLYKRRFRPKGLHKLDIQVKLYRVAPHYLSEVGRITMRDDVSHGWLWYDVTNAVQDCVTPRRRHADLFALSFRVKKPNGKVKSVSLRKFGRHHSMPFLVLYSNETEEVSFEQIDILTDRLWSKEKGKHGGVDSTISKDGDPSLPKRSSDSHENESTRENVQLDKELTRTFQPGDFTTGVETSKSRTKRSIYDNEIPENPEINFQDYEFVNTIPQTHPRVLKPRKESRRNNLKSYSSFLPLPHQYGNNNNNINIDNNRNENYNDNDDDDNDDDDKKKKKKKTSKNNNNKNKTSDNDSSIKRRRRKKTHRHKKFNHKQHQHHNRKTRLPFPKAWDAFSTTGNANFYNNNNNNNNNNKNNNNKYYNYHDGINNINNNNNKNNNFFRGGQSVTSGSSSDSSGGVCGRRRLTVDFADIGWGDWIISPKSFEAHYCSGTCPFPLNKGLHPSNHATIQSIVHAIGIHSNVPAPCCVPDKMSSVTLLYFDEDRNVVLKNYPGMTVESCACR